MASKRKARSLQRSLSILLPAHDVQATLTAQVVQVLEIAGELTDQLEVLIIDNGSSDHTCEVAHDLAVRYPQVRVVRSNARRDLDQALRAAVDQATGDVILAYCSEQPAQNRDLAAIGDLWAPYGPSADHGGRVPTKTYPDWIAVDRRTRPVSSLRAHSSSVPPPPRRPNFLARLRKFALED